MCFCLYLGRSWSLSSISYFLSEVNGCQTPEVCSNKRRLLIESAYLNSVSNL